MPKGLLYPAQPQLYFMKLKAQSLSPSSGISPSLSFLIRKMGLMMPSSQVGVTGWVQGDRVFKVLRKLQGVCLRRADAGRAVSAGLGREGGSRGRVAERGPRGPALLKARCFGERQQQTAHLSGPVFFSPCATGTHPIPPKYPFSFTPAVYSRLKFTGLERKATATTCRASL